LQVVVIIPTTCKCTAVFGHVDNAARERPR
jgi:hypothetical protein